MGLLSTLRELSGAAPAAKRIVEPLRVRKILRKAAKALRFKAKAD